MRQMFRFLIPCLVVVSLAACGGGSKGSLPPAPENLAQITLANAPTIASAVMTATYESSDLGAFADLSGGLGGAGVVKTGNVFSKVGQVQIETTKPLLTESQIGTFLAPIGPIEEACAVAGSTVVSGNILNADTLSVNDVITIQFNDCNDGFSVVDGTMSITIRSFSGDFVGGSVSFEVTVTLTAFSVTELGVTSTANGDITIGMNLPNTGPMTMTISSQNLTIAEGASSATLANFSLSQTIDPITGTYSLTVSGRVSSSAFEGAVDFTTGVTLQGIGQDSAYVGEIVITGDAGASIRVVILDGEFIRLDIDLNGDGVTDEVVDTTWSELI